MKQKQSFLKIAISIGIAITILFGIATSVASNSETNTESDSSISGSQVYVRQITSPPEPLPEPEPKPVAVKYEQPLSIDNAEVKDYAYKRVCEIFGCDQWDYMHYLWGNESGWEPGRLNKSSFACGIPQALPCTKIYPNFWSMERIKVSNSYGGYKLYLKNPDYKKEIDWGLNYILGRYKTPSYAWYFWNHIAPTVDINGDGIADGLHYY